MLGYTFQLYFDFSGTARWPLDSATCSAFASPRTSTRRTRPPTRADFWRRWHISLSSVLRDYLYIPLGGNRGGAWETYRNLMLTMLLGGLWHGASWTFVVWGGYHGLLLAAYRAFGSAWDRLPLAGRWIGTFLFVVVGWVFFRSTSFSMAAVLLRRMFVPTAGSLVAQPLLAGAGLAVAAALAMAGPNAFEISRDGAISPDHRWTGRLAIASGLAAALAIIAGTRSSPFLYFQF